MGQVWGSQGSGEMEGSGRPLGREQGEVRGAYVRGPVQRWGAG